MPAVIGWLAVIATFIFNLSGTLALIALLSVIVYASFGVMHRADALARRLGEPFGTIILTLSISVIEVAMVASVLLGPGDHASIARDTAFSGAMILLNFILGVAVLVGGLRHGTMRFQIAGASQYIATIFTLGAVTFVFPLLVNDAGALSGAYGGVVAVLVLISYVFFMWRQLGANSEDFAETEPRPRTDEPAMPNFVWLVTTLLPIVLLSHAVSPLLDEAVPHTALAGLVIAAIALLPETFTTFNAGWKGQLQRTSNLTHGALVSVVGLSVPTVLLIGALTGQTVVLGADPADLALLGLTMGLSIAVLAGGRATAIHGLGHLLIFAMYVTSLV